MKTWLKPIQQQLTQLIEQQRLPHALLFYGMKNSGKQQLSDWLVQLLLCQKARSIENSTIKTACGHCKSCLLFNSDTYPDHKMLVPEKTSVGVDDIRNVSTFLQKTAFFGRENSRNNEKNLTNAHKMVGRKTVVIPNAEQMTIAAANALLKTLEEPSDNSIIILLSADVDSLLPTIISRCRLISLRPPVGETLIGVQGINHGINCVDPFANISQLAELSDVEIKQQHDDFLIKIIHYLHYQQGFDEVISQLINNIHAYRWFEKIIVNLVRDQSHWSINKLVQSEEENIKNEIIWVKQIDKQVLWQVYQLILAANKQVKVLAQANKEFVYEKLLINCAVLFNTEAINS